MRLDHPGELTLDFVYYGPPLSGKSTSIQYIHDRTVPERRTEIETTRRGFDLLRCDILPATIPPIAGRSVRLSLRWIHGVCFRKRDCLAVLSGADGIVFVVDSSRARLDNNRCHAEELVGFLRECADPPPVVWAYNKRDLPANDLSTLSELDAALPAPDGPRLPTTAWRGVGVFDVLRALTSLVEARVRANFAAPGA